MSTTNHNNNTNSIPIQIHNNNINSSNASYCYIDIDIDEHRSKLRYLSSFVYHTNTRYGFSSKDILQLSGSEMNRFIDDEIIYHDHDYGIGSTKWNEAFGTGTTTTTVSSPLDLKKHCKPPKCGNRIIIKLYWDVAPLACENFATLCFNGSSTCSSTSSVVPIGVSGKPLTYKNCIFHRIVPNKLIQGGDIIFGNGCGGESIYGGKKFKDEKNGLLLQHNTSGIVSMGNSGKNSNSSQFFITLADVTKECDGKHVIFGKVISGYEILTELETNVPIDIMAQHVPKIPIRITDCGLLYNDGNPIIPGSGFWYDQPDPDSFTGYSSKFMVRPRVLVIGPNGNVLTKFQEVLYNGEQQPYYHYPTQCINMETIKRTSMDPPPDDTRTTSTDDASVYKQVVERIMDLLNTFAIDIVLVAPACSRPLLGMITELPIEFQNKVIQSSMTTTTIKTTTTNSNRKIEPNKVIMEAKPINAIHLIRKESWLADTPWILG